MEGQDKAVSYLRGICEKEAMVICDLRKVMETIGTQAGADSLAHIISEHEQRASHALEQLNKLQTT
jgi:hypothetical protein